MLVACVALMVALGGTSYAAIKIKSNTIGAQELSKVTPRTGTVLVDSATSGPADGSHGDAVATCRKKEQLIGGGTVFANAKADDFADVNYSGPSGNGWIGGGYVDDSETTDFLLVVTALCLAK
jgi:hypothetical protein